MKENSLFNKIIGFIVLLSGSIWLGSYAVRMIISYQLFDIDLNIMPFVNEQNLSGILVTINPAVITTFVLQGKHIATMFNLYLLYLQPMPVCLFICCDN